MELDSSHFPECSIHFCDQHLPSGITNPDWLDLRKGNLTASVFGAWLLAEKSIRLTIDEIKAELDKKVIDYPAKGKKEIYTSLLPNPEEFLEYGTKEGEAREKAICRLISESVGAWAPEQKWVKEEVLRGLELEDEAVEAFEKATGKKTKSVGFCKSIHGSFGCSPDALLIGESAGFEGKVPLPETHVRYRRAGVIPQEYLYQVHGSMACTGCESWHFQSYNPGLANLRLVAERSDFTERLLEGLVQFSEQFEDALGEEAAAWKFEFGEAA